MKARKMACESERAAVTTVESQIRLFQELLEEVGGAAKGPINARIQKLQQELRAAKQALAACLAAQGPWAILLCRFSEPADEPQPVRFYEERFTPLGRGTQNLSDYFLDASGGVEDSTGTRVFGWLPLERKRSDYVGSGVNPAGRRDLVRWARDAAIRGGVDLRTFRCIGVITNTAADLTGDDGFCIADGAGVDMTAIAHEMGHGMGLDHSRIEGSQADYRDPWDIMSAFSVLRTPHPRFGTMGPAMNAINAEFLGWLDGARVAQGTGTFDLRPLHRWDLPGFLAARAGSVLVEFRTPDRWDAGIGTPVVLVHESDGTRSRLLLSTAGRPGLSVGDVFERGHPADPFQSWYRIEVEGVDVGAPAARVRVDVREAFRVPDVGLGGLLGGLGQDGGGWVIVNGKIIRIPPRSPLLELLEPIIALEASTALREPSARRAAQRAALDTLRDALQASAAHGDLERDGFGPPLDEAVVRHLRGDE
jgi:hypothetical protein